MRAEKSRYKELGGYVLNPNLSVIVSKDKNGKFYIGQRQTFYNADKTSVNMFKRRATLCVTADDLRHLAQLFNDMADLHK